MSESTEKNEMTMGQRLRMLREIKNLSQTQLAQELNVSEKTISAWETGGREIGFDNAKLICDFFGTPNTWFCFGENYEKLEASLRAKIEAYFESVEFHGMMEKILQKCLDKLTQDGLTKKSYAPQFDYTKRQFVTYGLFRADRLPFRDGKIDENRITSSSAYEYSLVALGNENLEDIAKRVDLTDIHLSDLVECDSVKIFQMVLDKVKQEKHYEKINFWRDQRDVSEEYLQEDLNKALEFLLPTLNSFWEIIILLIENGAYYEKQEGHGDDVTIFYDVKDVSKTAIVYKLAMERVKQ